jgi:CubicO group peptidase (beta-lactamase class C family)
MANAYSVSKAGDALLVWERDSLVLEHYTGGFEADERHLLASGTKTFSGVMALAAADDGWLSLDERVAASIPSWAEDPQKSTVTIRQLLHLTSGIETGIGRAPRFEEALQTPLVHAPGEGFRYGPVAFQVFGAVLASNLADLSPEDYLYRRILEPIGAKAPEWFRTGGDVNLGAGARMTARDWLRFGRLLLGDGTFEGNVIITPGLLNALTTPTEAGPGYGLSVWLNAPVDPNSDFFDHVPPDVTADGPDGMIYNDGPTDLFMAAGLNNQRLFVIPSREMVVVRFGRRDRTWNDAEFLARLLNGDAYEASDENHASRMSLHATSRLVNRQMSVLDSTLSLTQSQRDAIRPIIQRRVVHLLEMRQQRESEEPLRRREKRQMLRSLRQLVRETDAAIRSHLTPQQQAAYEELREEQKQTLRMQRQR